MALHCRDLSNRWFEEIWNKRRSEVIDELTTDASVGHTEVADMSSVPAFKQFHGEFLAAFPDLKVHIEDTIAEGDNAVVRWWAEGTHAGEWAGLAATNRRVRIRGMTWFRSENGKVVEAWDSWSPTALMVHLRDGSAAQ